jgi:DNA-binding transcriptional MerR regulator
MTMFIHELARITGVSAKTIRYYESIGLMPAPERAENNYRRYTPAAIERLRYIVSARSLGFRLVDIGEFLAARDQGTLPCQRVLDSANQQIANLDQRIADLLTLRDALSHFCRSGATVSADKKCDESCTATRVAKVQEHGLKQITVTGDLLK